MPLFDKFKQKSTVGKVGDILFYLFILFAILPPTRVYIIRTITSVPLFSPKISNYGRLSERDYGWKIVGSDGKIHQLSEFRGKVLFINFWATWCPPCVAEIPSIEKLYSEYKDDKSVVFIAATNDDPLKVNEFIIQHKLKVPVYYFNRVVPPILTSNSIPTTFIVDKSGDIVIKKSGAFNWGSKKIIKEIKRLTQNR